MTVEKKDRIRNILGEIAGTKKTSEEKQQATVSQTIKGGSNNTQISGNNNKVGK